MSVTGWKRELAAGRRLKKQGYKEVWADEYGYYYKKGSSVKNLFHT